MEEDVNNNPKSGGTQEEEIVGEYYEGESMVEPEDDDNQYFHMTPIVIQSSETPRKHRMSGVGSQTNPMRHILS